MDSLANQVAGWSPTMIVGVLGLTVSLTLGVAAALILVWRRGRALSASLEDATSHLDEMTLRDGLTGLMSRIRFDQALADAAQRAEQQGTSLAALYLDLDEFRIVNDAYGYALGDQVLVEVARRLEQIQPRTEALMRVAGDEFALVVPGGVDEALAAVHQVQQLLARPIVVEGQPIQLAASFGVALYPQHGARALLIGHAAAAMRSVKRMGGGAHAVYEPVMSASLREQAEMVRDLRQAVERGSLQLLYQPKVDAATLQVTAAEALLRWHDPRRGVVRPDTFISLAERHGLMHDIGRWVVDEACRQAAAWLEQGLVMRVAVNVSGVQLRDAAFVDHLQACLQRHAIEPGNLTCEITESVAMEDTRVTHEAFERLSQAGVHVSIDDFGTGHSSLARLRELPAAELKIDRSFVADLEVSDEARSIASSVVQMAHTLERRVVAEGVETEGQRDLLVEMGCDELQGYLFARPMSATALGLWAMGDPDHSPLRFRESLYRDTQPMDLAEGGASYLDTVPMTLG